MFGAARWIFGAVRCNIWCDTRKFCVVMCLIFLGYRSEELYLGVAVCDVSLPLMRLTLAQVCGLLIKVCCYQCRVAMATDLAVSDIDKSYLYADASCKAVGQSIGWVTDTIWRAYTFPDIFSKEMEGISDCLWKLITLYKPVVRTREIYCAHIRGSECCVVIVCHNTIVKNAHPHPKCSRVAVCRDAIQFPTKTGYQILVMYSGL